jgi:hypothetical protein
MGEEEDLFTVLDGIQQATKSYGNDYEDYGRGKSDHVSGQDKGYYAPAYPQQQTMSPTEFDYYYTEEKHVPRREMPPSAIPQQQTSGSLTTPVYPRSGQ